MNAVTRGSRMALFVFHTTQPLRSQDSDHETWIPHQFVFAGGEEGIHHSGDEILMRDHRLVSCSSTPLH